MQFYIVAINPLHCRIYTVHDLKFVGTFIKPNRPIMFSLVFIEMDLAFESDCFKFDRREKLTSVSRESLHYAFDNPINTSETISSIKLETVKLPIMTKEVWFNLGVKDLQKSKAFFTELGFAFKESHNSAICECMILGEKNVVVMFFDENTLQGFMQHPLTDMSKSAEMMISFDAESPDAVDAMAERAEKAGANVFGKPQSIQGWMYGFAFADLDGHRWNMLYMDPGKMAKP